MFGSGGGSDRRCGYRIEQLSVVTGVHSVMREILRLLLLTLLLYGTACSNVENTSAPASYLYTGRPTLEGLRYGDVITSTEGGIFVRRLVTGGDTTVTGSVNALLAGPLRADFVPLTIDTVALQAEQLIARPYRFTYAGEAYWASFERTFTGFPEFARTGAGDFVNHSATWSATTPGIAASEYSLVDDYGLPVLLLAGRDRGQYIDDKIVVVDSVGREGFAGRIFDGSASGGRRVTFGAAAGAGAVNGADDFITTVNRGYSRAYLLNDTRASQYSEEPGLPRRAVIDRGDLSGISAAFLPNGEFMLLSDDHLILQGSSTLDLDKGILTVAAQSGLSYYVFVAPGDPITFTVPVSVVELVDGELRGADNFLRLEVVE